MGTGGEMNYDPRTKTVTMTFQDLEHVLGRGDDLDESLIRELYLHGVDVEVSEVERVIVDWQQRTVWAPGTPEEYLKTHKGRVVR